MAPATNLIATKAIDTNLPWESSQRLLCAQEQSSLQKDEGCMIPNSKISKLVCKEELIWDYKKSKNKKYQPLFHQCQIDKNKIEKNNIDNEQKPSAK